MLIRIKSIVSDLPTEISDIFDICKNEISLSGNDHSIVSLYTRMYFCCLAERRNMTLGNFEITPAIRESISKSTTVIELKLKYKNISDPRHIVPSLLLRMNNNLKAMSFYNEKMQLFKVEDILMDFIKVEFTGETWRSKTFTNDLLKSSIEIN